MCQLRGEESTEHTKCISLALFVDSPEIVSKRCRAFRVLMMLCRYDAEFLVCLNAHCDILRTPPPIVTSPVFSICSLAATASR